MKKKAFIIASFLLLTATAANAAICPTLVPLGELTEPRFIKPSRVAVAGDGTVYVADYAADGVFIFYRNGKAGKKNITQPFSVAIDSSGRIYVGTKGKVTIYDSGFSFLNSFSLPRTVALPRDLLVKDDILYVVDGYIGTNEVQLFDINTFEQLGSFDGPGLEQPKGIAPLPSGGFTVVDNTRTAGGMGGAYIYNSSGGAVSGNFITYGLDNIPGDIASTGGVAADGAGRIIISDTLMNSLNVFDGSGNFITGCEMKFNTGNEIEILYFYGMEYADSGKLYVAAKGKVFVYGVDDYTDMSVSPGNLGFEAQTCGQSIPAQSISIANGGPGVLSWEIASDQPWLIPASTAGSVNGIASVNVDINIDPSGLSIGTYTGNLTITSPGATDTVSVTLNVGFTMPVLNVSPASLTFSVTGADIPPHQTVNIVFTGDLSGALSWNATPDVPWLGVAPSSGDSNTQAFVNAGIEPAGLQSLSGGQYAGNITVTACAEGSPATVPVTLDYVPGGTINVTTNTEAASFTLDGPDNEQYSGSGTSYSVSGVTAGTYSITFAPVVGFKEPDSYSLEVVVGQDTDFEGNYRDLRERNNIIISVGDASAAGPDEVKMFDGDGVQAGAVLVSADSSSKRTVTASGDIDGDGTEELLVSHDLGIVTGFTNSGTAIEGLNFRAFPYKSVVDIAVTDVDGDGLAEIIAGAGSGADNPAAVRVFKFVSGQVLDTGVNFLAYQKRTGVNVSAGDVDGDGKGEILTLPGGGGSQTADIRIWKVQDDGAGGLEANAAGSFVAAGIEQPVDLAAGDLNADAVDEIILSSTTGGQSRVDAYSADGSNVAGFATGFGKGAYIGAGDTDFDGTAEIVAGEPTTSGAPVVNVYDAGGNILQTIEPFSDKHIRGAEISLGRVVGQ